MKFLTVITLCISSWFLAPLDVTDDITNALKQGKAQELVKYFDNRISIKVLGQEDMLSKSQSEAIVLDFFNKHKVKNFQTSHSSVVNSGNKFITGTLETTDGGKYRVSILLRGNVITQFRIEND